MRLEIWSPVAPFIVGQGFGANIPCVKNFNTSQQIIVSGADNFTCPVGYVKLYPLLNLPNGHNGLDLFAPRATRVYSSIDGVAEEIQTEIQRGLGVGIVSHVKYEMDAWGSHYAKIRNWHFMSIAVAKGQSVKIGDLIGLADSTGFSSGDHDHFEFKPVEKNTDGMIYNVYQDNGWYGACDPTPFLNGKFAYQGWRHVFVYDMQYGMKNDPEVKALQHALNITMKDSENWEDLPETGNYLDMTMASVKKFQSKYGIISWGSPGTTGYGRVGPKTRSKLNELFS